MKVTAIKAQAKNPERLSVFVDEKYAFSLTYSQLLDQKIYAGLEINEIRLVELKHLSNLGKAYERALNFVMLRPRSRSEVLSYARRKRWTPEDTQVIIGKLVAHGYINDAHFARAWIESRAASKRTSQRKLRMELKQKGVADDIINSALDQSGFNEQDALQQLIAKKRKLARYANDEQKLMQYLARQGFGFDAIKNALNH